MGQARPGLQGLLCSHEQSLIDIHAARVSSRYCVIEFIVAARSRSFREHRTYNRGSCRARRTSLPACQQQTSSTSSPSREASWLITDMNIHLVTDADGRMAVVAIRLTNHTTRPDAAQQPTTSSAKK